MSFLFFVIIFFQAFASHLPQEHSPETTLLLLFFFFSNLFKVIKSLDPRHNTDSTSEIYSLKSQVHEKDSYISYLEVSAIEFDSMPVFFKKKKKSRIVFSRKNFCSTTDIVCPFLASLTWSLIVSHRMSYAYCKHNQVKRISPHILLNF